MRLDVVTIFPDYFTPLTLSLVGKAAESGIIDVAVHDLRDWTSDPHRTVDDSPAGGGAGMVMKPDIWGLALDDVLGLPRAVGGDGQDESPPIRTPSGTSESARAEGGRAKGG